MTAANPPARLFVLLARAAPVGLILRRGPTNWVKLIHWNTKNDTFRHGQWFHGRIYEHRCDLSPDGKWFAYCAYKPNNRLRSPDIGDTWTAVSRPPLLTAVGLWRHWDISGGGGLFLKDGTLFLNHMDDNRKPHPAFKLPNDFRVKTIETYEDESNYMFNHVHLSVMLRDGWKIPRSSPHFYLTGGYSGDTEPTNDVRMILDRSRRNITLICQIYNRHHFIWHVKRDKQIVARLRHLLKPSKVEPYASRISYQYRYVVKIDDVEHPLDGVTWADLDQRHRLVLAKDGKLFAAETEMGELVLTELGNFNEEDYPKKRRER